LSHIHSAPLLPHICDGPPGFTPMILWSAVRLERPQGATFQGAVRVAFSPLSPFRKKTAQPSNTRTEPARVLLGRPAARVGLAPRTAHGGGDYFFENLKIKQAGVAA
jgi:hypothetical protein